VYVYRWDLDKTYLQTDFDSVRGLLRTAMEPPEAKRNVPGSAALMRALSTGCGRKPSRVVIISGSPTQMREVLEKKLKLDGVRYDTLTLKDNLGNLRRGRFRAIRGQFGYKLPCLLKDRAGLDTGVIEALFGDDAEVDALVYSVYADIVAGRLTRRAVTKIMEAAGGYTDQIAEVLGLMDGLSHAEAVSHVFIHLDRGVPPASFAPLGSRVIPIHSWFQAALVLRGAGRIDAAGVATVATEVMASSGAGDDALANLAQDIVRRGHLHRSTVELGAGERAAFEALAGAGARSLARLAQLGQRDAFAPPAPPPEVDYARLVRRSHKKKESR